ncbi:MAG: orotidine-5'-phosphate decarboxylase [Polyangiaceae bacterium]
MSREDAHVGASRIIFALDFPDISEARAFADRLGEGVGVLKVGLELFVANGEEAVSAARRSHPVFLDLKLHDIPQTVERAVERAADLGAKIVTVHASGGKEMLRRAAKVGADRGVAIAAVTVLTSLDQSDLMDAGIHESLGVHALRLARVAFDAGVRAFVCSPKEVRAMRGELGSEATLITPGVRSSHHDPAQNPDDQKRVATANDAIRDGADYIVVGRPIRNAADPKAAAAAFAHEIEVAVSCAGS